MKKDILSIPLFLLIIIGMTAQEKKIKDSIFFKLNPHYMKETTSSINGYLLTDKSTHSTFFLERKGMVFLKKRNKETINLKKFIRNSEFYQNNKIRDVNLVKYLNTNFIVFLVDKSKKHVEYIEVFPMTLEFE